jgi:diguanylate cyclase (GGDEF)-like protein
MRRRAGAGELRVICVAASEAVGVTAAAALAGEGVAAHVVDAAALEPPGPLAAEGDAYLVDLGAGEAAPRLIRRLRMGAPGAFIAAVQSGASDDEVTAFAVEAGADTVLGSPFPVPDGPKTLTALLRTGLDWRRPASALDDVALARQQLQSMRDELSRLGVVDPATQAYNDTYLARRLEEEVGRALRYRRPLAFLAVDIDDLEVYSEANGSQMTALVLRQVVSLAKYGTRLADAVCRRSDGGFAVLLPETNLSNAVGVAEKLRRAVADFKFAKDGCQPHGHVTLSIGCAELTIETLDADGLLEGAAGKLAEAKRKAGDTVAW